MTAPKGGYMSNPTLYRKRLIPEECILLKDDRILHRDDQIIVTGWYTLKPRKDLHHGFSCYYLAEGFKISRFYKDDDSMAFWYCDIVDHTYDADTDTYVFTDLLVDVIVYPDGFVKVVDLDELVTAKNSGILSDALIDTALLRLDHLLQLIYRGEFPKMQKPTETYMDAMIY